MLSVVSCLDVPIGGATHAPSPYHSTSVNVYFNTDGSYCDTYGCTVSGYVNEYVEGQDSLSLCQVVATGELYYEDEPFDTWIPLSFVLPEVSQSSSRFWFSVLLRAAVIFTATDFAVNVPKTESLHTGGMLVIFVRLSLLRHRSTALLQLSYDVGTGGTRGLADC